MKNVLTFILLLNVIGLGEQAIAQRVSKQWKRVPTPSAIGSTLAFDTLNLIFKPRYIVDPLYYSSNRGETWNLSFAKPSYEISIVKGVAILVSEEDSSWYASTNKGHSWTRHSWVGLVPDGHKTPPQLKLWYDVGKGWYERLTLGPEDPNNPWRDGVYRYYRQDEPFGPLVLNESFRYDIMERREIYPVDSDIYLMTATHSFYRDNGLDVELKESVLKTSYFSFAKYLGESTWIFLAIDTQWYQKPSRLYTRMPILEYSTFPFKFKIWSVANKNETVIASFGGGAYLSRDRGRTWGEMRLADTGRLTETKVVPEFEIVDSLHIFMRYNDTLYYTSTGGGPTIPLSGVHETPGREASAGIAVVGSTLSVPGDADFELLDILGRAVIAVKQPTSAEPLSIDLTPYPDGIYFVRSGAKITKILWQRR